jgi:hypothetical protein
MRKKTYISIAIGVAVLGLSFYAYNRFFNKKRFAKMIKEKVSGADLDSLMKQDLGYLRARAFGLKNNNDNFVYKGKTYSTQTGKFVR